MTYFSVDIGHVTITIREEDREWLQNVLGPSSIGRTFYEGWITDDNPSPAPIGFGVFRDGPLIYADFHNLPYYYRRRYQAYHNEIVRYVTGHSAFRSWTGHACRFEPSQLPLLLQLLNELVEQLRPAAPLR